MSNNILFAIIIHYDQVQLCFVPVKPAGHVQFEDGSVEDDEHIPLVLLAADDELLPEIRKKK